MIFFWLLSLCCVTLSWAIEPITTISAVTAVSSVLLGWLDRTPCRLVECCDRHSVSKDASNVTKLEKVLRKSVYGQHLMQDIILSALKGHLSNPNPSKALVLSLHGSPGSGKSYVSQLIAQSLYVRGMKSNYVKKFVASKDFPNPSMSASYKINLHKEIEETVKSCERSLFIFEDVSLMPPGVLNAIHPFIDYHEEVNKVDYRKSIFIFISNIGDKLINNKALEMWSAGKRREDIYHIKDFEDMIRTGAFNEDGGLQTSGLIKYYLVDKFIPFLPLEEKHVRKCVVDAFRKYGFLPSDKTIDAIIEDITFEPEEIKLFAKSGCKSVVALASSKAHSKFYDTPRFADSAAH